MRPFADECLRHGIAQVTVDILKSEGFCQLKDLLLIGEEDFDVLRRERGVNLRQIAAVRTFVTVLKSEYEDKSTHRAARKKQCKSIEGRKEFHTPSRFKYLYHAITKEMRLTINLHSYYRCRDCRAEVS